MNLETNKTMKEIVTNLQNWQTHKKDVDLMNDLLSKADSFKIDYKVAEDNSESFHLYPALEIFKDENQKKTFELVFYMISKNRDTDDFLDKHIETIGEYIKEFKVINKELLENTQITEEEAQLRKERWSTDLKSWIGENEMFEVFDIPSEDFNLNDEVLMQGHFGMKVAEEDKVLSTTGFSPDIIIQQLNLDGSSTSFFDMARLSPPFGRRDIDFALLNKAM